MGEGVNKRLAPVRIALHFRCEGPSFGLEMFPRDGLRPPR